MWPIMGMVFLLAVSTWDRAAIGAYALPIYSLGAGLLLILCVLQSARSPRREACPDREPSRWIADPFALFGGLFLLYLGVQWWNAGRTLYFDVGIQEWRYTPPPHPYLPYAFTRPEAAQMLGWFFPAWVIGIIARSRYITSRILHKALRMLSLNAGLLALLGIVQYATGTTHIYWVWPAPDDFFASFTYTNHAAAYFVMMGAVSAGFFFREFFRKDRPVDRLQASLLAATVVLCLTGANLSLSRAGVILAWLLTLIIATYGLSRGWRILKPAARVNLAAGTVGVASILYFAVSGFGSSAIREEFAVRRPPIRQMITALAEINLDLSDRPLLWQTAWNIFKENPWYGTGGWGFRYFLASHLPSERWSYIENNPGRANVHNDPLQFLAEFGIMGGFLLTLALGSLAYPLFRNGVAHGSVFTMTCTGLVLVLVFSLIDLPFRCPAILWTWTGLLAALPKLCSSASHADGDSPCC